VECGLPDQYNEFKKIIPPIFSEKLYVVPGNHEVRWDEWAGKTYQELFGHTQYSFDKDGLHFIALDPTDLLREAGYCTKDDLDWLNNDLEPLKPDISVIIYLHFPIGEDHYYICNQESFFDAIEGYNVRAVFSGHVHQENKWEQNGPTFFS